MLALPLLCTGVGDTAISGDYASANVRAPHFVDCKSATVCFNELEAAAALGTIGVRVCWSAHSGCQGERTVRTQKYEQEIRLRESFNR